MVDGTFVYNGVTLVSACFDMSAMFGCQALIVVFTIFALGCEVDQCFICVTRQQNLIDGVFVYCQVTLVSACLSCNECKVVYTDGGIRVLSPDIWG